MNHENLHIRGHENYNTVTFDLYVRVPANDGTGTMLCCSPTWDTTGPQGFMEQPSLRLTGEMAQQLMNDLYNAGYRPPVSKTVDSHVAAMTDHISDMRETTKELFKLLSKNP